MPPRQALVVLVGTAAWLPHAAGAWLGVTQRAKRSVNLRSAPFMSELFVIPDVSKSCVVFQDEQVAIAYKPAGVPLMSAAGWVADGSILPGSTGDPLVAVTQLSSATGGLVPIAKTAEAAACLHAEAASSACKWAAVVSGAPKYHHGASCGRLEVEWLDTSAGKPERGPGYEHARSLSLINLSTEADLDMESVCNAISASGLCVVGAREVVPGQKVRVKREVRRTVEVSKTAGGLHLALVEIVLPSGLEELRAAGSSSSFSIAPPKRWSKMMKNERLEAERKAAGGRSTMKK